MAEVLQIFFDPGTLQVLMENSMIYQRQRVLLEMLDVLGGAMRSVDFQKLLFLYCQDEESSSFDFVPYRFGCFSYTSYADKRKLIEKGLLESEEDRWVLTEAGRAETCKHKQVRRLARSIKQRFPQRGDALVAEVYRRHPWHAIRSEIAQRVLRDDTAALQAIEAHRKKPGSSGLFTIGYEGASLEEYMNRLLRNGMSILCDVRRNPLSRKYGFSKGVLSRTCESLDIRYEHLPELGIPGENRRELNSQADYDALFEVYERDHLPTQTEALQRIRKWMDEGHRVALTCFERHPEQCHRHCVAEGLHGLYGKAYTPQHL